MSVHLPFISTLPFGLFTSIWFVSTPPFRLLLPSFHLNAFIPIGTSSFCLPFPASFLSYDVSIFWHPVRVSLPFISTLPFVCLPLRCVAILTFRSLLPSFHSDSSSRRCDSSISFVAIRLTLQVFHSVRYFFLSFHL